MQLTSRPLFHLCAIGLLTGAGFGVLQGCDDPVGNVAEQCGLDINCEAGGFADGRASISGVASIDAFFGAAIDLDARMRGLDASMRAELDAIAASVGLEPGAAGVDIRDAVSAHLGIYVEGGLSVEFQPARCQASVEATASAAAECDAEVDPGSVTVSCSGSCQAEAGVAVDCGAEAELRCSGVAPDFQCSGTCTGTCSAQLEAAASCDGTCRGTCEAGGSTMDGFDGRCGGMCTGRCDVELEAGASCDGQCEGTCDYTPPSGMCEASAQASCEAMAGASIECDAGCEGSAEPPSVSAECEATVEAKASASLECTPPTLDIAFTFNGAAAADLDAQAEFRAWLQGFRGHISGLVAARAEADAILQASASLVASSEGALRGAVEDISASGDLAASIGAACALDQLPIAATALGTASTNLTTTAEASLTVLTAF